MADLNTVFISSVETAVGSSVSQNKPLIVYITDSGPQANEWIDSLITPELLELISSKSVALKLVKDTQQCQMFEQIFPNVIVPSVFCIRVSVVLDVIHGEVDKDAFEERIKKALDSSSPPPPPPQTTNNNQQANEAVQHSPQTAPDQRNQINTQQREIPSSSSSSSSPRRAESSSTTKPKRTEKKTLKEQAAELAAKKYREEQIRKAQDAKEERERIRRLLKADQEERRAKDKLKLEQRERERRLSNGEEIDDESKIDEIIHGQRDLKDNIRSNSRSGSDICALAIRLLNGHSLQNNFKTTETLHDVRNWLDAHRTDGDAPYCFHRTIPRVTFDVTDEEKSLESLELAPRSALILKPYSSYATAYSNTGQSTSNGLLSRFFGGITNAFWGGGHNNNGAATNPPTNRLSTPGNTTAPSTEEQIQQQQPFSDSTVPREPYRDEIMHDANSPQSSFYASPVHSPMNEPMTALDLSHPSTLSLNLNMEHPLPQRPHTPQSGIERVESPSARSPMHPLSRMNSSLSQARIRTLNANGQTDDRLTYNGNHLDLEDDDK